MINKKYTGTTCESGIDSSDLLADLEEAFGLEQLEERWNPYGYSVNLAMQVKAAYEEWAQEDVHFDCMDNAIIGGDTSGGLFPARIEAFFAAWVLAANLPTTTGKRANT